MKLNILVVYWHTLPSMRTTTQDHLRCFERHLAHHCYYLNLGDNSLPRWVKETPFDLIVFHDLFFCGRWGGRALFDQLCAKIKFLKNSPAYRIAVPQDEFMCADLLCEFINDFNIGAVFSVAPETEWPKIYRDVDRSKVQMYCVLTGYLETTTLARIESVTSAIRSRPIDIGYRAGGRNWRQAAWLGRHGALKIQIADVFLERCPAFFISTDISTRSEDTFIGDSWYEFLARCKYQIGLEGGASVLDWDGSVRTEVLQYVEAHPESTFEEIETACFPGLDGEFALFALSPRHLEACATRTCQILVEGAYNGVLEPWKHYIPLKRDFSNLDQVLGVVRDDGLRESIVEAAYIEIVASGKYSYKAFAEFVVSEAVRLGALDAKTTHGEGDVADAMYMAYQSWEKSRPIEEVAQTQFCAVFSAFGTIRKSLSFCALTMRVRHRVSRIPGARRVVNRIRNLLRRS